ILDLDGTTIPNSHDGLPSAPVKLAIKKAQQKISVSIATSRNLAYCHDVIQQLGITSPSVVDGGAQLFDPVTKTIIWEQAIHPADIAVVWSFLKKHNLRFHYSDGSMNKNLSNTHLPKKALDFIVYGFTASQADEFITSLSHIPTLALHKITSWTQDELCVKITHASATKLHGVSKIAELLNIHPSTMIGIGDSYNDFPLLMACGLKVAMGNAVADLKEIADYVAPSIVDDGLVDVINKFILNPN
ncbi:MAG TPA: HAD-IIB family hydrolase, partial [Patescibacteria group bacterium]|nr:HAD-IIB family hydrolase [Patescibacteria group bacterium]